MDETLYTLAISGSELMLLTSDTQTGQLIRQQALQELSQLETQEILLNNHELSPTLLDQLLLCPTGNGYLHGYDLSEQRWAWSSKYPSFSARFRYQEIDDSDPFGMLLPSEMSHPGGEALAIAAEGHVVMAPPDSAVYFCLNAATGKLNWSQEQKNACQPDWNYPRTALYMNPKIPGR
ncbi:MAG: hypothetical protein R3C11_12240 [Planctomycetaceae bacterium]